MVLYTVAWNYLISMETPRSHYFFIVTIVSLFIFNLNSNIETGRYNGTSREDRFCQFCPSLVKDEMHFLLRCAKYQNIRTSYNSLFQKEEGTNDADLLRVILNSESISATKQIRYFIKDVNTYHNDET